jgi:hypothetical protein
MKQCMMTRLTPLGHQITQMAWLPKEFAVEGRTLDLKDNRGWDYGWLVVKVYDQRLSYDEVRDSVSNQRSYGASIKP